MIYQEATLKVNTSVRRKIKLVFDNLAHTSLSFFKPTAQRFVRENNITWPEKKPNAIF